MVLCCVIQFLPVESALFVGWVVEFFVSTVMSHPVADPVVPWVTLGALRYTFPVPECRVDVALSAGAVVGI